MLTQWDVHKLLMCVQLPPPAVPDTVQVASHEPPNWKRVYLPTLQVTTPYA
jgi:hypothetical protein